jgi:ribosomal protein S18 acetylase RimI-like enzyme
MASVQTNLSDTALVNAIRGNLCDFFRYLANRLPPGDQFENDRFVRWHTPLSHAWFNGFLCSAPPTPADKDFIRETIQYFKERRVETFSCWLEPPLKRSAWETVLSEYNFDFSGGTPGMAVDLGTFPEIPAMPDGLEIRAVEDKSTMRTWAHVFTIGYGMPPVWENTVFDVWYMLGLDFPVQNYLGYLDGIPVCTSTVFYGAGVAGIYDVATLPEARGRGLGTALTLAPLLDARQAGYRIGILQSSEMGFGVYKRMGFRHLCQIENFYLKH